VSIKIVRVGSATFPFMVINGKVDGFRRRLALLAAERGLA
jgi:hypothetical protein